MEVRGLRRAAKNIAHNYTEPQKKVREATSNDPWGPSSTIMSEISDLTYNIEAFAQIMEMLWKRLNDSGKNWRHVYKALVLIDYLIKTGSERVAAQCKENIFAIQTLKDFQHYEENKDQGMNVREKAKQLISLLGSEERLRVERERALKARERFAQQSAFSSSGSNDTSPTSPTIHPFGRRATHPSIDTPHSHDEEELQLQLALAMSKEEADNEEKQRRSDELRLQMALSQSEQEFKEVKSGPKQPESSLLDLLDVDLGGASALPVAPSSGVSAPWAEMSDPWATPQQPWTNPNPINNDPWATTTTTKPIDPWAPKTILDDDQFNNMSRMPTMPANNFLGQNSSLVNLNNLVAANPPPVFSTSPTNPFGIPMATTTPVVSQPNPFHATQIQKPSINEMRQMQTQSQSQSLNFQSNPNIFAQQPNNPWQPVDK